MAVITNQDSTEKYYFKAFGLTISSPIPVRGLIAIEPVLEPDIQVKFEKINKYPELHITKVNRKGLTATFGMFDDNTNDAYMIWENQINFRLIDGKTMIIETKEEDLDFLSLFIVSEPLGILLFQRGDILLHASAVMLPNGDGIVFMGEPGAGKSTTAGAFVKAGCKIISDDLVAIRFIENTPYLVSSFPQLKLWKQSIDGLGFDFNDVQPIGEGNNKYAFENKDNFENGNFSVSKIYILGENENKIINKVYVPLEILKYNALPHQIFEVGITLKKYHQKNTILANFIEIESKRKIDSFESLSIFVENLLVNISSNK